jgi:hypothetical protein
MNKTVIIDCDDQGNYSVGEEPHESPDQEAAEQQGEGAAGGGADASGPSGGDDEDDGSGIQMQPAKSLDDALKMAKALLMQGSEADQAGAEDAFKQGYADTAGPSAGGAAPAAMA